MTMNSTYHMNGDNDAKLSIITIENPTLGSYPVISIRPVSNINAGLTIFPTMAQVQQMHKALSDYLDTELGDIRNEERQRDAREDTPAVF